MKTLKNILLYIMIIIYGIYTPAYCGDFSDKFAHNLTSCTEYSENSNAILGIDKGKCVMQADYYTCNLSTSQAKELSDAIIKYNKKVNENGFSYNAYKRRMMVFNRYINNPKVCTSKVNTNFVKPKN